MNHHHHSLVHCYYCSVVWWGVYYWKVFHILRVVCVGVYVFVTVLFSETLLECTTERYEK